MNGRTNRTPNTRAKFLKALAQGFPVGFAAEKAGMARRSVYDWRDDDEDFRRAWDDAIQTHVERMEMEADRRAVEGVVKPVFYKGEQCGELREYSDTLMMFRLKATAPEKYRENVDMKLSGGITVSVTNYGSKSEG